MKIISSDYKSGVKVSTEYQEDLWYLSHIIDAGDFVSGKTERKIKIGGGSDQNAKLVKKTIFLKIEVEKVEFSKHSDLLRIGGKVVSENDDVPKGSHHTFDVDLNTDIKIEKNEWLKFQKDKLHEAAKSKNEGILILVIDRSDATFALLKKYGYERLLEIEGDVQKKGMDEQKKESGFYAEIAKKLGEYNERYQLDKIIVASPAFWKDDFVKQIKDADLKKKIITATCSASKNALDEVIKSPELNAALKDEKASQEAKYVEELLSEISKSGKAAYGLKEVKEVIANGAVETLLITDLLIHTSRNDGTYSQLDYLMRDADRKQAEIKIISSENDAGKKLDGLGGIGAILRYKMSY